MIKDYDVIGMKSPGSKWRYDKQNIKWIPEQKKTTKPQKDKMEFRRDTFSSSEEELCANVPNK